MASLDFKSSYFLSLFPLDLLIDPIKVTSYASLVRYDLLDGSTLRLNGTFSGSGDALSGDVTAIRFSVAGSDVFTLSGLDLSLESLLGIAANSDPSLLLAGHDFISGTHQVDVVKAGSGNDVVVGYGGSDRLYGEEGNDLLFGGWGDDVLLGGAGNDVLIGEQGSNRLLGGSGDDFYVVSSSTDVVAEYWNNGTDTVETTLNAYTLSSNVENLTARGADNFIGQGNGLDNIIRGSAGDDILKGFWGDDSLFGGNGNDLLLGGGGNDRLIGDRGADLITTVATQYLPDALPVSISLTMPEISETNEVTVSGYISNSVRAANTFNLAFVLDVSGSMSSTFSGDVNVGDQNADGVQNTLLDGAIASFAQLIQSIKDSGLAQTVNVSLIPFSDSASSVAQGMVNTDLNNNGVSDLIDAARTFDDGGGTNYKSALNEAVSFFDSRDEGGNYVFFISDGQPNSNNYASELALLTDVNGINASIRSIALGDGSNYQTLDLLDDGQSNLSSILVKDPADLDAGLISGNFDSDLVAGVAIYKNNELVTTLSPADFTVTPFGVRYTTTVDGLSATGQDKISASLLFKDASVLPVSTSQLISVGALASADTLYGGNGDDYLDGGADKDLMYGGSGDDTYRVNQWDDSVIETANGGIDTIETDINYSLAYKAHVENLTLLGSNNLTAEGNGLNNIVTGNSGNNILRGLEGDDVLDGAGGIDTASFSKSLAAVTVNLASGTATGEGDDTLLNIENIRGSSHSDYLTGDANNNELIGGDGNDTIYGNSGDDLLIGGLGNDRLDGDYGVDTVSYETATQSMVIELASYNGSATGAGSDTLFDIENVIGSKYNDTITATTSYHHNVIKAGAGHDTVNAGGGDDTIIAGWGNDTVDGGVGIDLISYEEAANKVTVNLTTGLATGFGNDTLSELENIIGSRFNDTLTGNIANNELYGGIGNDTLIASDGDDLLDGGVWADTMFGGKGDDTYIVDNINDKVFEYDAAGLGGFDIVNSSVTFTLANFVERLNLIGFDDLDATGNSANNQLDGNNGNNKLIGLAGDDVINGNDGDDIIKGGLGDDQINGGNGTDHLIFELGSAVTVSLSAGSATGQGADSISYIENVTASNQADNIVGSNYNNVLLGLLGNDTIDGGYGNDTIDGGGGDDLLQGGSGDDVLIGGWGADIIDGGSGNYDLVDFSGINQAVTVSLFNGTAVGQGSDTLTGIEQVIGTFKSDVIKWDDYTNTNTTYTGLSFSGLAGNDTLYGSNGSDVLDGGLGADLMAGGEGSDTYIVDNVLDVVDESGTYDSDTVISSIGYTLGAGLENLTLVNTAFKGEGNELNNTLTGTDTSNALRGFDGSDHLIGAGGRDWLTGGAGKDYFEFTKATDSTYGSGSDVISDFSQLDNDVIDLSDIDAIQWNTSSYDSFAFIGTAEFTEAGQLRYETNNGNATVYSDLDGDGIADIEIQLLGVTTLDASDFYV